MCATSNCLSLSLIVPFFHQLDLDLKYFWEWTDFISYLECMAIFAFFTGLLMFFFINEPLVVETYGLVALVTESLLASPQFYRNFKSKSTEGMRFVIVALALPYTLILILPFAAE